MRSSDTAAFDTQTGEITTVTAYSDVPRAQKMKGWFYAFHTGSWGGMTTKVLYFLAAFIGGILPLSGYYLWLKKKRLSKKKKSLELSLKQNVYKNPNKCQSDFFMNNFFPKSRRKESRNSV